MRKLNYLALAAIAATALNTQAQVANPKDADGKYIVKWDIEKGAFADANDWEIDETFVFAVDLKGTPLADALKTASRNPKVLGRGVAYDLFVTSAPEGTEGQMNIDGRLVPIKDDVYGMVVNFFQQHASRFRDAGLLPNADFSEYGCLEPGAVVEWNSNIFGFGWSETNAGEEWWEGVSAPMTDCMEFSCAPYTGTKTSPDFFYGDIAPEGYCPFDGLDAGAYHSMCDAWGGYAPVEFWDEIQKLNSGVSAILSDTAIVSSTCYDLQGRKIAEPERGLYIRRDVKADGTVKSVKVVK